MTNAQKFTTPYERSEAYEEFVETHCHGRDPTVCNKCKNVLHCVGDATKEEKQFGWLEMEYIPAEKKSKQEKVKKCPFCGWPCRYEETVTQHVVRCEKCGYMNVWPVDVHGDGDLERRKLIRIHNAVSKKVFS